MLGRGHKFDNFGVGKTVVFEVYSGEPFSVIRIRKDFGIWDSISSLSFRFGFRISSFETRVPGFEFRV